MSDHEDRLPDPLAERLRAFGEHTSDLAELAPAGFIHDRGDRRRRRQRASVAVGTLAAVALVGGVVLGQSLRAPSAGSVLPGSSTTTVVGATPTVRPTPAARPTPAGPAPSTGSGVPSASLVVITVTGDRPTSWVSPSGNIACVVSRGSDRRPEARCDIATATWTPPPKPATCDGDWGGGLSLNGAGAGVLCHTDTVLGVPVVGDATTWWDGQRGSAHLDGTQGPTKVALSYGAAVRLDTLTCVSAYDGVHCTDTATGHGFDLARESYSVR